MTDIPIPPPHEPLLTTSGLVNDNWYRYWENQSRSLNSASTSADSSALAPQQHTFRYEPTFVSSIPRVDNETQVTGESMKYSEWWVTTTAVHRWTKPTNPYFRGVTIEIAGGAGGGGNVQTTVAGSGVGGGGCGGGWAIKKGGMDSQYWDESEIPDELVFVVGHGGRGGGWTTGAITTANRTGSPGEFTCVVASSKWDALSTISDAARLTALRAMVSTQLTTVCVMWADGGSGGLSANSSLGEFQQTIGIRATNDQPKGARAFGGDFNGVGASGAGNALGSVSSADLGTVMTLGHGGACGKIYDNLWHAPLFQGSGGYMKLAGCGAPRGGGSNAHIGSEGGLYGGGGAGGVVVTSATTRRRGGWGGWGAAEIIEFYRETT